MKTIKKRSLFISLALVSAAVVGASAICYEKTGGIISSLIRAENLSYTLTLDDTNQPNLISATEADVNNITDYIAFSYTGTNMSKKSGRHIVMTGGGTITLEKQIRGIKKIKVTAPVNTDSKLVLFTGYTKEDVDNNKYGYPINGTSEVVVNVDCNYFKLYDRTTFGISSLVIEYECPSDGSSATKPTGDDKLALSYGGTNKTLTYDDGVGTFMDCQTNVVNPNGVPYSYKYSTFQVDVKFPSAFEGQTNSNLFGMQLQKTTSANGSVYKAVQFSVTSLTGENNLAVAVNSAVRENATYALEAETWYTFKTVITANDTSFTLSCYINDTLVNSSTRQDLGWDLYYYGLRNGAALGGIQFKNLSLTGSK